MHLKNKILSNGYQVLIFAKSEKNFQLLHLSSIDNIHHYNVSPSSSNEIAPRKLPQELSEKFSIQVNGITLLLPSLCSLYTGCSKDRMLLQEYPTISLYILISLSA